VKEIVLATRNKHKVEEITQILKGLPYQVVSVSDFKGVPEVVENGKTLEANAIKKARTVAKKLKRWALADDTGLEVSFLNGAPGVISARWAGSGCTYEDNNRKLLRLLDGVARSKRKACFRCVIALAGPQGQVSTVEGSISGIIDEAPKGRHGFGYDPLFLVPRYKKTFAQLGSGIKNRISHRAKALRKARKMIKNMIQ